MTGIRRQKSSEGPDGYFFEIGPGHAKLAGRASKPVYKRYPDQKGPFWPFGPVWPGPGLFQKTVLKRQLPPKTVKKPIIFGISENPILKAKISERGFREGIIVPGQTHLKT